MEAIDAAYRVLLWISAIFISLLLCACLVLAIIGPRFTDRIVAINLICAKGIIMITILSFLQNDSSLLDIAVVYSMISFLVVVVLSKCYTTLHTINPFDLPVTTKTGETSETGKKENTK
jgi:multicomponent Na+:H+ antiporter subunit F